MKPSFELLVVDDDIRMGKTLVDILTFKGYPAIAARSGPEALRLIQEQPFDCVLSDIKMDGINGVQLARELRKIHPDLPVILMTAYSSDELIRQAMSEGALAVLAKPIHINALLEGLAYLRKERSIVIINDDQAFCENLQDTLARRGFSVTCVMEARPMLDDISAEVGVLLLDLKLYGEQGAEVLQQIRQKFPELPILLITPYLEEVDTLLGSALKLKIHTCLYRPFEIETLLHELAEIRNLTFRNLLKRDRI